MDVDRTELDELTQRIWRARCYLEDVERLMNEVKPDLVRISRELNESLCSLNSFAAELQELLKS